MANLNDTTINGLLNVISDNVYFNGHKAMTLISSDIKSATNGSGQYITINENLKIAWGYKTSITGNGVTTISLPCAFQSSTSFVVIATLRRGDSSGSGVDSIYTYPNSATSFKVVHDYTSSNNPDGVYWFAIGV